MAERNWVIGTLLGHLAALVGFKRWAARHMLQAEIRRFQRMCADSPDDQDGNLVRRRWIDERARALTELERGGRVYVGRDGQRVGGFCIMICPKPVMRKCTSCRGTRKCALCWDWVDTALMPCSRCRDSKICWTCNGIGEIEVEERLANDIPF